MKLHPLDLAVLVLYMAGVVGIGWWLGRKQRNLRDYFLSDKNVPWWAIAASIVATETSTVTFISVPGFAFTNNFTFLQLVMGYMIGRLIVVTVFVPLYFRGELFTVYQILDRRFSGGVKRAAASLFLVTRSAADGIRLYLTALMLVAITGWADPVSILIIGILTILYTYIGGMSAVIWTDVIQLIVYLAGAVVAGMLLLKGIPGGWNEVMETGKHAGKFQVFDFASDMSRSYTFWAGLIGGAFLTTATHGTDQLMVQRYLASRNSRDATRALLASGVVIFAQFALFLFIGVLLFVFYQHVPGLPEQVRTESDRVFPYFMSHELPPGVAGLVVAAVFAAAMSTLSSSLNSLSATAVTDFYRPLLKPNESEAHYLKTARWLTAAWGIVQIIVAIIAIQLQRSAISSVLAIASFTNGPILGLFFLSTFTRRVGARAALAGFLIGLAAMTFIWLRTSIAWPWYALIGSAITFSSGGIVNRVFFNRDLATDEHR